VSRFLDKQLVRATISGRLDRVAELLESGVDLDRLHRDGFTPLSRASVHGHAQVVRLLVARGADVNRTEKDGAGALFWACVKGHAEVVEVLLAAGANVNQPRGGSGDRDRGACSPLNAAIGNGHVAIAKTLVLAGASLDHRWLGRDIAEYAQWCNAGEFLSFLKEQGRLTRRRRGSVPGN
jgi:ankyrin repeat protein